MFKAAIPLLRISSAKRVQAFYCDELGFSIQSVYRADHPSQIDPAYVVLRRDETVIHVSSFPATVSSATWRRSSSKASSD